MVSILCKFVENDFSLTFCAFAIEIGSASAHFSGTSQSVFAWTNTSNEHRQSRNGRYDIVAATCSMTSLISNWIFFRSLLLTSSFFSLDNATSPSSYWTLKSQHSSTSLLATFRITSDNLLTFLLTIHSEMYNLKNILTWHVLLLLCNLTAPTYIFITTYLR